MKGKKSKYVFPAVGILIIIAIVLLTKFNSGHVPGQSPENTGPSPVEAEKTGSSPESGATSKLKQGYDFLVSKGANYGDSQPSDWPFSITSTYWKRILYSALWSPDGTATESDVSSGKTFYSNSRTKKTGTVTISPSIDFSSQQYVEYDDYDASDYTGEESTWIKTSSASGANVYQDTRTGLYWSSSIGSYTNDFSSPSTGYCDFFSSTPRSSYGTSGTDPDCGNAINACAVLSLSSKNGQPADTDWYLPSQKELKQAYRDGIYNQAGSSFTTMGVFWSSTENSNDSANAWDENLGYGRAYSYGDKTLSNAVRCVRRD
jgi:hypothetical protein